MDCPLSILPPLRIAAHMHNRNNKYMLVINLVQYCIREPIYQTPARSFRKTGPCFWKTVYT